MIILKGALIILLIILIVFVSIKFIYFHRWKKDFIKRATEAHAKGDLDTIMEMQEELRVKMYE